jgi:amidase
MATATQHRLSRDQIIWGFGPNLEPALEIEPGDTVTLETNDCFTGQITSEADLVTGIDMARVNSATGPIAVTGAEPGDSLVVEFLSIDPVEQGVATIIPGFGQLIDKVDSPKTHVFRVEGDEIVMTDRIRFPARPMVGVIGVATEGEELTNAYAGRHGGNLDDHLHGPGSKVYFPVRQAGGMFAVGDMHAAMGDGEICGTGVEIAGEVTVRFDLVKGRQAEWPVTELADRWVTHGTSLGIFMEAMHAACEDAAKLLVDQWGFTIEEAFVFLSVACDVNVCQACQPSPFSAIARVEVPKIDACPLPFAPPD